MPSEVRKRSGTNRNAVRSATVGVVCGGLAAYVLGQTFHLLKAQFVILCIVLCSIFVPPITAQDNTPPGQPYILRSREEAEQARKQRELQTQTNIVERIKVRGATHAEVVGVQEGFALQNAGITIRTWEDWTNRYQPDILNPPVQFDAWEAQPMDFSSPVAAFRAFEHAVFSGNTKALLTHADESGCAWLKQYLRVDENAPRQTYTLFTNMSVFTVLLTASDAFQGNGYTLVLARKQGRANPQSERVSFVVHFFRREGDRFVLTGDMSVFGPFGSVRSVARATEGNLMPYPEFFEKMQNSAFPPHFYTISD